MGTTARHSADVKVGTERQRRRTRNRPLTASIAAGVGTFSVSRVACGLANSIGFEVFTEGGTATFDTARPAEFSLADARLPLGGRAKESPVLIRKKIDEYLADWA